MFPYIRAFISIFTANLGNTTNGILIPTQFFKGNMDEVNADNLSGNNQIASALGLE
jgi:hypothetical protein